MKTYTKLFITLVAILYIITIGYIALYMNNKDVLKSTFDSTASVIALVGTTLIIITLLVAIVANLYSLREDTRIAGDLEELPDDGDVIPFIDFAYACNEGIFNDDDGYGHPVVKGKMDTTVYITPSDVLRGKYVTKYSELVWFNK